MNSGRMERKKKQYKEMESFLLFCSFIQTELVVVVSKGNENILSLQQKKMYVCVSSYD